MLWAMLGMLAAIWVVVAIPFAVFVLLRRRKARRAAMSGIDPRTGLRS
jgi:heme/copper-type cytochrome/quinol oxidase subunit 2